MASFLGLASLSLVIPPPSSCYLNFGPRMKEKKQHLGVSINTNRSAIQHYHDTLILRWWV